MKELTVFEMEEISGGAALDFGASIAGNFAAAVLGATTAAVYGTLIGGTQSGANDGLLGFGLIGNGVGAVWGFIAGGIIGGVAAFAGGWDKTLEVVVSSLENVKDGKFVPWSQ